MRALIGVDLTGVLEDPWPLKRQWLRARGYQFGPTPMTRGSIMAAIGGDDALYQDMIAAVYSVDQIPLHPPIAGALETIVALSSLARFAILTSRLPHLQAATIDWLATHGFLPLTGEPWMLGDPLFFPEDDHKPGSKLTWCATRGAIALIDDGLRNLEPKVPVPGNGAIAKLLFGDYVRTKAPSSEIIVVHDWAAVFRVVSRVLSAT